MQIRPYNFNSKYTQATKKYHHFILKQTQQNQIIREHGQLHLLFKFQQRENDMVKY